MTPQNDTRLARTAGILYLLLIAAAPFALLYVPQKILVRTDPAATVRNLVEHGTLFRIGIASHLVTITLFAMVAVALYRLLRRVHDGQALLMMVFALISTPVSVVIMATELAAVTAVSSDYFAAMHKPDSNALIMLLFTLRSRAMMLDEAFWGLWLLPLGLLILKSRFLPRFIGVWLLINGTAYIAVSLSWVLLPSYARMIDNFSFPAYFGEVALALWLAIKGVKNIDPQPTLVAQTV